MTSHIPQQSEHVLDVIKNRRTIYVLTKDMPITEEQAVYLIKAAVQASPSTDRGQTTRICILLGKHHDDFWNMTKSALYKVTSEENAAQGAGKIEGCFQAGYGTVLFFEDERAMQAIREAAEGEDGAQARDDAHYVNVGHHNCAAAQFAVWSVLAQAGVGASLQHYQGLMAEPVRTAFKIPPWWTLNSMMPFGGVGHPAEAKSHSPMEERFLVKDEDGLSSYGANGSSRSADSNPQRPVMESEDCARSVDSREEL